MVVVAVRFKNPRILRIGCAGYRTRIIALFIRSVHTKAASSEHLRFALSLISSPRIVLGL